MLIVYIDSDLQCQEKVAEMFKRSHRVVVFSELFEAYKWIKRNQIPDLIVAEIDIENSMGLQALKFLQSKSKLKNTYKVGYTQHFNQDYRNLILSEGASEIFDKSSLLSDLSQYIKFITTKKSAVKPGQASLANSKNTAGKKPSFTKPKITRQKKA